MTHEQLVDVIRRMTECDQITVAMLYGRLRAMYERGELDEPVPMARIVKVLVRDLDKWRRLK